MHLNHLKNSNLGSVVGPMPDRCSCQLDEEREGVALRARQLPIPARHTTEGDSLMLKSFG